VRGVGPVIAAGLIGHVDIAKADHVSSLWKYAGLHVVDGAAARRRRGERADWNPQLRAVCRKLGGSFMKARSQYRPLYEARKRYEQVRHPDFRPIQHHRRALRYMVRAAVPTGELRCLALHLAGHHPNFDSLVERGRNSLEERKHVSCEIVVFQLGDHLGS
jgi:hypothetical protein